MTRYVCREPFTAHRKEDKFRILITAGPTREPLDPVRFISNYSTATLGYCLAREAKRQGYGVTLISGPTSLCPPAGVSFISVTTAEEMYEAVRCHFRNADCLLMTAAVCDFRLKKIAKCKIKKARQIFLRLEQTPDILYEMGKIKGKKILVGFALESNNLIKNARGKLKKKNLDLIVAQKVTAKETPFGENKIKPVLITRDGRVQRVSSCSKTALAGIILGEVNKIRGAAASVISLDFLRSAC